MSRKAIILYLIFLDYYIIYDIIMLLTWILLMQLSSTFVSAFIFLSAGTSMINMLLHRMMHDLANKHLWYNIFVCLFMTIVTIWHKRKHIFADWFISVLCYSSLFNHLLSFVASDLTKFNFIHFRSSEICFLCFSNSILFI